jgi:hypothetical protein
MDPFKRTVDVQVPFDSAASFFGGYERGTAEIGARKSSACTPPAATRPDLSGGKACQTSRRVLALHEANSCILGEPTYPIATQVGAKGTFGTLLSGYMITSYCSVSRVVLSQSKIVHPLRHPERGSVWTGRSWRQTRFRRGQQGRKSNRGAVCAPRGCLPQRFVLVRCSSPPWRASSSVGIR